MKWTKVDVCTNDYYSVSVSQAKSSVTLGQHCRHFSQSCRVKVTEIDSGESFGKVMSIVSFLMRWQVKLMRIRLIKI